MALNPDHLLEDRRNLTEALERAIVEWADVVDHFRCLTGSLPPPSDDITEARAVLIELDRPPVDPAHECSRLRLALFRSCRVIEDLIKLLATLGQTRRKVVLEECRRALVRRTSVHFHKRQ